MGWPKAITLDFYGTVVKEDHELVAGIAAEIARASDREASAGQVNAYWGRHFEELCLKSFGDGFIYQREVERQALGRTLEHFESPLPIEGLLEMIFAYWASPAIYPESKDVLAACPLPIHLVTNIDNAELHLAMKSHELSFPLVVSSEDCRAYKPRPEPFQAALATLGVAPHEVLHVGDSYDSDVAGAQALGIPVLWLDRKGNGVPEGRRHPEYVADSLAGVLGIVR